MLKPAKVPFFICICNLLVDVFFSFLRAQRFFLCVSERMRAFFPCHLARVVVSPTRIFRAAFGGLNYMSACSRRALFDRICSFYRVEFHSAGLPSSAERMFARLAAFDFASILENKIKQNQLVTLPCSRLLSRGVWHPPVFAAFVPFGGGEALFHFISRERGPSSINRPTQLFSIECARTTLKFL
jgi:hypothetical protein